MKNQKFTCLILIYTIFASLFAPYASPHFEAQTFNQRQDDQSEVKGLQFRVREAKPPTEKPFVSPPAEAVNLSEAESSEIFRRLPPMPIEISDRSEFSIRDSSLLPPKTGNIIPIKFPADATAHQPPSARGAFPRVAKLLVGVLQVAEQPLQVRAADLDRAWAVRRDTRSS